MSFRVVRFVYFPSLIFTLRVRVGWTEGERKVSSGSLEGVLRPRGPLGQTFGDEISLPLCPGLPFYRPFLRYVSTTGKGPPPRLLDSSSLRREMDPVQSQTNTHKRIVVV